jgi:hypothetical protein
MRWEKLGRIFNPVDYKLPNNCLEFAQSPQALVFDDFVRVYFSTRERDKTGKYLSHISFVDFDKEFKNVLNISTGTVIDLGSLGCYDEHGIFPLNVIRTGDKILGYIGGWSRRVSVSVETSIGLSVSYDNGLTFKKIGPGPVLTATLDEPFLVGDPFTAIFNSTFHMWYIYGTSWIKNPDKNLNERVYKIGHATSADGYVWRKTGRQIIPDRLNHNECQALPCVIYHKHKYHLLFCYRQAIGFRENKTRSYRIGYAQSEDLLNWIREDHNAGIDISENDWDSDMLCYPHMFHCNERIYLLYNGNEFGRFGFGLAVLAE